MLDSISFSDTKKPDLNDVLPLYIANSWSSASKPDRLIQALHHSDSLITAWEYQRLVGLGNAISDGYLVVYFPHLIVHPKYQDLGIGSEIMRRLMEKYRGFHQQMLVAVPDAIEFYKKCGFERAGETEPMWIYSGSD
ncbi:MAG: GNAT family N-acetyltransferase [Oscillatoriophycideae cyanobacterium NC_groundwater_1537_Pr4_S-0.65um_50_18]|nr:GNAT family N-acetyltransferase [Oscillatoriophycideae cyanobacterium NC_groundwater_1537_Pr4_S-0.65um_50_18]